MFVSGRHGSRKIMKTSFLEFCYIETKILSLKLRHIEINASSSASIVCLAKAKAITRFLTYATVFSGHHFHVTQRKSLECSITKRRTLLSYNVKRHVSVGCFI